MLLNGMSQTHPIFHAEHWTSFFSQATSEHRYLSNSLVHFNEVWMLYKYKLLLLLFC